MYRTIHAAAAAIRQGQATPLDLLDQCLRQIDKHEARIRAFVSVDAEGAREQAQQLTAELKSGPFRGPLHGIPIAIKDNIDVFDLPTAAGSKLWANSIAREDATLVAKLRQTGAVILGKAVTTQYASFDPSPTRNPWNTDRTPGGSSSGPAAAVACGMCLAAIGSQTGGSITRPASYCGVASCKPTFGRVSTRGIVPLAASMDHPGPMARCVWDLALILQIIAGDPADAATLGAGSGFLDLLSGFQETLPPRLGRVRGLFEDLADQPVRAMMTEADGNLRAGGATIEEVALPAEFSAVLARHRTVMAVEAAAFLGPRVRHHPEDFQPNITKLLKEGLACPAPEYARCKAHQHKLRRDVDQWFGPVDVLLTPATTSPAPDKATTGDPAFNSPWSYTGLPTVSIPCATSADGMPLAIQLVGRPFDERTLFAAALWCEKALGAPMREPPC
jgi:Asp-tRNA(Asn)/Glu-tRNA(Gln) amidotransferase A subunit family amidase